MEKIILKKGQKVLDKNGRMWETEGNERLISSPLKERKSRRKVKEMRVRDFFKRFRGEGAELTNRLIPGDPNFEYPEWVEEGLLNGQEIKVYYQTTPEDKEIANRTGDWSLIDWEDRIIKITDMDDNELNILD